VALCRVGLNKKLPKCGNPHITILAKGRLSSETGPELEELRHELDRLDLGIELYPGAEVFVTDDIFYADGLNRLAVNHSRYLLVEFPYSGLGLNSLAEYIREIQGQGLVPVIAHPERYEYFQKNYELVNILAHRGALYQINADSLCRRANKREYKLAGEMFARNMASFLATDAHSARERPNNLLEMICQCLPESGHIDI
jgi:protein-tyrosine phosphatase